MEKLKLAMSSLIVMSFACGITGCGGGGQNVAPNTTPGAAGGNASGFNIQSVGQPGGGQPAGPADGDLGDGWQRLTMEGGSPSFEMPKPIKQDFQPEGGMVIYVSRKGKEEFRVAIAKRKEDPNKQMSDQQVLGSWADSIIKANTQQFGKMGFPPQYQGPQDIQAGNAMGKQYQARVGKALVIDRFYINPMGLFWVEMVTRNPQSPDVNRFLSTFRP